MKNCRTCEHADWFIINGRRRFYNYTECNAPTNIELLPASAWEAKRILEKPRQVIERDNKPIDCAQYLKKSCN